MTSRPSTPTQALHLSIMDPINVSVVPPTPSTNTRFGWFKTRASRTPSQSSSIISYATCTSTVSTFPITSTKKAYEGLLMESEINKDQYHAAAKELLVLSAKIEELKKEVELKDQLRRNEVDGLHTLLKSQSAKLQGLESDNQYLDLQNSALAAQITALQTKAEEDAFESSSKQFQIDLLTTAIEELKEDLEYAEKLASGVASPGFCDADDGSVYSDVEDLDEQTDLQVELINELQAKITKLEAQLAFEQQKLQPGVDELITKNLPLTEQIAAISQTADDRLFQQAALEEEVQQVKEKLKLAEEHAAKHLLDLKQYRRGFASQLKTKDAEIMELKAELIAKQEQDKEAAEMAAKLQVQEDRIIALEAEKTAIESQNGNLKTELSTKQACGRIDVGWGWGPG